VRPDILTAAREDHYGLHPYARMREGAAGAIIGESSGEAVGKPGVAKPQDGRDTRTGRFLRGHRFWEARSSSGPAPKFADGETLWSACVAYFDWVADNPVVEMRLVTWKGHATQVPLRKMRPMSKRELFRYLNIAHTTWAAWKRDRPDLELAISHAEAVIYDWMFSGAAVGIFDAGLVINQLGIGRKADY
jgi:DNA-packaging protein gp3